MLFPDVLCLVRGGGDLATGVIYRLTRAGFPVLVLELEQPRVVRRMAAVAQAMFSGEFTIGDLTARRLTLEAIRLPLGAATGEVPVIADPSGEAITRWHPPVLIDGRMAKAPQDTTLDSAPFVVGLGPGFVAGVNCRAVIETQRGHNLGRVIWQGAAQPDTGRPESVMGYERERVLRAPAAGVLRPAREIGDFVQPGETVAWVNDQPIRAPFAGLLRGLMQGGLAVTANEKIGDLDPRPQREHCFTISDKSLAAGGGAVEAVLSWLQKQ